MNDKLIKQRLEILWQIVKQLESDGGTNYNTLSNKPSINGITLYGNKTFSDLGLTNPMTVMGRVDTVADLSNVQNPQTGWVYFVGLSTDTDLAEYVYTAAGSWQLIGSTAITIDSSLSTVSENPVQNKVITGAITPISETEYSQLPSYTLPVYFIYED